MHPDFLFFLPRVAAETGSKKQTQEFGLELVVNYLSHTCLGCVRSSEVSEPVLYSSSLDPSVEVYVFCISPG